MSGNRQNFLESIIKVEPYEFQQVTDDYVLRLKANMLVYRHVLGF